MTTVYSRTEKVLVGRGRELQTLRERCARAGQGQGGFACLEGEAGIGKTALLRQICVWAAKEDFAVLWGGHLEHGPAPLHGLRQALGELFGISAADDLPQVERRVQAQVEARFPELARHRRTIIGFFQPFDPGGQGGMIPERSEGLQWLHHLLFRLLGAAARQQPLLMVLDDLHWAETRSLDCLAYLSATLADQRVLLLGAYRPEEPALETLRRLAQAPQTCAVPIPRLDFQATVELATHHGLSEDPLFWQELHQRTEGVPLFVEQWLGLCQAEPEKSARLIPKIFARALTSSM